MYSQFCIQPDATVVAHFGFEFPALSDCGKRAMLTDLGEATRESPIMLFIAPQPEAIAVDPGSAKKLRSMFSRWGFKALCLCLVIECSFSSAQTSQLGNGLSTGGADQGSLEPRLQTDRHPQYRVMPSDVLAVSFALSTELNQQVTVQPDGFINLANVGSVYVQGQTTPEVVETLKKTYAKILHDPIIGVDLTNFQASEFTIFGNVGRPGQYQLRREITVSQAIAIGGGFLTTAKSQAFLLRRVSSDWVEVKKMNLKPLTHGKNLREDVFLQPGDMIYVPETAISKFRRYLPYGGLSGVNPLGVASLINQND